MENITTFITQYESLSWFLYIMILAISVASPLPNAPVVFLGGYLFGPALGIVLTMVGEVLGASISFSLVRWFGQSFFIERFPKLVIKLHNYKEKFGWQTIFLARLIPSFSFDIISIGSGLSNISYRTYIIATTLGIIPLVLLTTFAGHGSHTLPIKQIVLLVVGGIILIATITYLFRLIIKNKNK